MDYLVRPLREGLDMVPHYHDSLLIDGMWRDFGTYTWKGSEWRKGSFMLDMITWDLGIEEFLYDRIVHRSGIIQWRIWDLSILIRIGSIERLSRTMIESG